MQNNKNTMNATEKKLVRHFTARLKDLNAYYDGTVTLEELVDSFVDLDENLEHSLSEKASVEDAFWQV